MRYLPLTNQNRIDMMKKIGVDHIDELFSDIPPDKRLEQTLDLPNHRSEAEVERIMQGFASKNRVASDGPFFIGAGAYKHHIPASVDHLIQRSEFLTAYTPYQPEIAQGTLQMLFEFQTQIAELTGMEIANASMYDGSTATLEAVTMAMRVTKRHKAVLSGGLHPHYCDVIVDFSRQAGQQIERLAPDVTGTVDLTARIDSTCACLVVQSPDFFGHVHDLRPLAKACQSQGVLLIAAFNEPIAFGLIEPPGAMGADIVAGEGQALGVGLNYGGPYLGLFATKQRYVRQMPGRLCGQTVDANGERGFVLTLSTREQHIRREKATSNICTNSGLCALAFSIHLSLLGRTGLQKLARLNHYRASQLADGLARIPNITVLSQRFFNEFTISVKGDAAAFVARLAERNILAGVAVSRLFPDAGLDDLVILAATETSTPQDQEQLLRALS